MSTRLFYGPHAGSPAQAFADDFAATVEKCLALCKWDVHGDVFGFLDHRVKPDPDRHVWVSVQFYDNSMKGIAAHPVRIEGWDGIRLRDQYAEFAVQVPSS